VGCGARSPAGARGPALAKDGPAQHHFSASEIPYFKAEHSNILLKN